MGEFISNSRDSLNTLDELQSPNRGRVNRHKQALIILAGLVLMLISSMNCNAQGRIIVIENDHRPTKIPTELVTHIPGATRRSRPILLLPMELDIGDVLVGSGNVSVKVRCNDSSELALTGEFRVRFLHATARACNLNFEGNGGATMIVRATGPTNVQSGEISLGSRRTTYQVRIPDENGAPGVINATPDVLVYEDEIDARSPVFSGTVKQGQKLVTEGRLPAVRGLTRDDFRQAAKILAVLDETLVGTNNGQSLGCYAFDDTAYARFLTLNQNLLENPHNSVYLMELQGAQMPNPTSLQGDYKLIDATAGVDTINKAIERSVKGMWGESMARRRLRETLLPPTKQIKICYTPGSVSITTNQSGLIQTPSDGREVKWTRGGSQYDVSTKWVNRSLQQIFRSSRAVRVNTYSLSPDGRTLTLKGTAKTQGWSTPPFKHPLNYEVEYRRN